MIARLLSPLTVIFLALLASLAIGPGLYYLSAEKVMNQIVSTHRARAAEMAQKRSAQKAQGWDFWTVEMESLASDLKEEKAQLQAKSDALDRQAARLTSDRQELEHLKSDLERMQREIDLRVISIREDEKKNLRSLAATYAALPPASAVAIIREMDDSTVVKILSLMKADVTAPIFEAMAAAPDGQGGTLAKRAAQISDKIRLMKSGSSVAGP